MGRLPAKIKIPKILSRGTNNNSRRPIATLLPKLQCNGTSKSKLKRYWIKRMVDDGHKHIPTSDDPQFRYGDITELARNLGYDTDIKHLDPAIKLACRCTVSAVAGCAVCRFHGGSAKQVIQAGKDRLLELVEPSIHRLGKIVMKGRHDPAAVSAANSILDRVGLKKTDETGGMLDQGWSDEMIARMADILDESEIETLIKLTRKLQAGMPTDDGEEKLLTGTDNQLIKVVNVGPKKMAELIKSGKKR